MKPAPVKTLLVEWTGTDAAQLPPRLRTGQLPALAALAATGGWHELPATPDAAWPWPEQIGQWRAADTALEAFGWDPLPAEQKIAPADIDDSPVRLFPPPPDAPALREALAHLYSVHNAAIEAVAGGGAALIAVRYEFLVAIAALYAASPLLAPALLAAHRLLDLLLHDLRVGGAASRALVLCAPPREFRPGFALLAAPGRLAGKLPRVPSMNLFSAAVAQLAGLGSTGASGGIASDLTAYWLSPEIVPAQRWQSPPALAPGAPVSIRAGQPRDDASLRARFPTTLWPPGARVWVAEAPAANIVGGVALTAAGGLTVDWTPALDARPERLALLQAALGAADALGLRELFTTHLVTPGDARHQALAAEEFVVSHEQVLWRMQFPRALQRLASAPAPAVPFTLRPSRSEDVEFWRRQDAARRLIRPDVTFDADLSFVACDDGQPAGLLLAQRTGDLVWCDVICATRRAIRGGCFATLLRHGFLAWGAAGCTEIVFATEARGTMAASARRGGAQVVQQGVRLHRPPQPRN